jgi:hypothetical protein
LACQKHPTHAVWAKAAAPNIEETRVFPTIVATIPVIALPDASDSCKYNINPTTPIEPIAAPVMLLIKWDNRKLVVVT